MAKSQHKLGVDICISVTGIAGPDGSAEKPVGLVWVIATPTKTIVISFNLLA